jgi:hypothetical protein
MNEIRVTYTGSAPIAVVFDCALYAQKDRYMARFWRDIAANASVASDRNRRTGFARRCDKTAAQWEERAIRYAAGLPVTYQPRRKRI